MARAKVDLSDFYRLSSPKKAPCQIGLILAGEFSPKLSDEEVEQLTAALAVDKNVITGQAVVDWLKARGVETNGTRVSNHRRGVCSCDG